MPSSTQKSSGSNLFDVSAVKSCCWLANLSQLPVLIFLLFVFISNLGQSTTSMRYRLHHIDSFAILKSVTVSHYCLFFPALKIQFLRLNGIYWSK